VDGLGNEGEGEQHDAMTQPSVCPRPLLESDARALIALLAIVEVGVLNGSLDHDLRDHVARRSTEEGLLRAGEDDGLERTLDDLNQRARYALGEYEESQADVPVVRRGRVAARTQKAPVDRSTGALVRRACVSRVVPAAGRPRRDVHPRTDARPPTAAPTR
jgi:hypothetical protein